MFLKIFGLACIPTLVGVFAVLFKQASGPFWLSANNDPAYYYFFNSLYLLDRLPLYATTHPGLTLDLLGMITIKMFHPFLVHEELFLTVIKNPELYLHVMWGVLVFVYVLSLGILGWYAYKKSQDVLFAICMQLSSLLVLAVPSNTAETVLPVMAHVKPETLLATAINLLMAGLLKLYWNKDKTTSTSLVCYLAFVCAFGVFTKYTFILSILLVFFLLKGFSSRIKFILIFIVFGYMFSLIETDPFNRILVWGKDLILKSGSTGTMSERFIETDIFLPTLFSTIKQHLFLFLLALPGLVVGIYKKNKLLWMASLCVLFQFLIVAKHPGPHYMITAVGLSSLMGAFLYYHYRHRFTLKVFLAIIGIFIVINGVSLNIYLQKLSKKNKAMLVFSQELSSSYPGYAICPYYMASSPIFVLACYTNNMRTYYNELLKKKYPDYYYYDINARDFKDFLGRWVPFSEIKSGHRGVLLYGTAINTQAFLPATVVNEIKRTAQQEAVYEVSSQQSPHAKEYLNYSLYLYSQGQYEHALKTAIYANQLGLTDDIQEYVHQLVDHLKR